MLRRPIRLRQGRTRFSTGLPPQFLAEKSPAAVQSGAHRADRTTRCGWRLGVNPAIQVTQHHHLTITRRQAEDRALHPFD